jgi:hypothetical protein
MAQKTYNNLITGITATIKTNSNKSISGDTLQGVLVDIVDSVFGAFSGNTGTTIINNITNNYTNGNATGITAVYYSSTTSANTTTVIATKVIEIGPWDMDTNRLRTVSHGLNFNRILSVSVIIVDDANTLYTNLLTPDGNTGETDGGFTITSSNVILERLDTPGYYDTVDYSNTTFSRGRVTIQYLL